MTVGLDYVDAKARTARYAGAALERLMLDQAIRIVMAPRSKPCIVDYQSLGACQVMREKCRDTSDPDAFNVRWRHSCRLSFCMPDP